MQRVLLALFLGAAAAFAPPARTLTSRTALGVNPIDIYSAAEDCLQEECSVDTVQMLVGQLKTREQELAKKGRIVGARCPRSEIRLLRQLHAHRRGFLASTAPEEMSMARYPRRLTTKEKRRSRACAR